MNNLIEVLSVILLASGMLASCAKPNPHLIAMTAAVHNASSKVDHEALAAPYQAAAKDMRDKSEEHKQLLSQYKAAPWLYGKQTEGFESHCAKRLASTSRPPKPILKWRKLIVRWRTHSTSSTDGFGTWTS